MRVGVHAYVWAHTHIQARTCGGLSAPVRHTHALCTCMLRFNVICLGQLPSPSAITTAAKQRDKGLMEAGSAFKNGVLRADRLMKAAGKPGAGGVRKGGAKGSAKGGHKRQR